MISPKLREIVCCPRCRGPVREQSAPDGLLCETCALVFPIVDGLPNMVLDEVRAAPPRPGRPPAR